MAKRIRFRYKICFQTKNKVWIYKNSRLRNFYKIRNRIVLKQGKLTKKFLVTKNMKWTVARRHMVPYFRMQNKYEFEYKNMLFNKQQLKNFYGGLKEYQIRNIFKKTWNVELFYRRNIFIAALEQRLNMVLYRMKLLPTIYACTQLIRHQGIYVNNVLITLPSFRVNLGEIVSIPEVQWGMFYDFLIERIKNRFFGQCILIWRKERSLTKIQFTRLKNRKFFFENMDVMDYFMKTDFHFQKIFSKLKKLYIFYKQQKFKKFYNVKEKNAPIFLKKFLKSISIKKKIKFLQYLIYKIYPLKFLLKKLNVKWYRFRAWGRVTYFSNVKYYINTFCLIYRILKILQVALEKFQKISKLEMKIFFLYKQFIKKNKNILLKDHEIILSELLQELFEYKLYLNNVLDSKLLKNFLKDDLSIKKSFLKYYKKAWRFSLKSFLILNYRLKFLIRQLRLRKKKKKIYRNWCPHVHWYIPRYLEVDFRTLRGLFVYYPESSEISYGFLCSFNKLISFYKERSL
jgi:ribosomal protein S4